MSDINDRSWFTAKASKDNAAEIVIYDEIGVWGVTAKDFHDELKAFGDVDHIDLHINSPGGEVFAGISIYNMLERHKATITVTIDGIAASMASVVAMAGDTIIMPENAMMMIHDPAGIVIGTSKDMRDLAAALDKMKAAMITAYASKATDLSRDEIAAIMAAETWLTAQEAVDKGFADEVEEPVAMAATFDLSKFKNAPAVAGRAPRGNAHQPGQQERSMTEAEKAAAAKLAADAKAEAEAEAKAKTDAEATAKAAAEAAAKGGAETAEQMQARITAEVKARHEEIVALCKIAGAPAKALDYIAANKTPAEVRTELLASRTSDGKEINARHAGNGDGINLLTKHVERINARLGSASRAA